MKIKPYLTFAVRFFSLAISSAQDKKFAVHTIAFYNLENLFDTINDPNKMMRTSFIPKKLQ